MGQVGIVGYVYFAIHRKPYKDLFFWGYIQISETDNLSSCFFRPILWLCRGAALSAFIAGIRKSAPDIHCVFIIY